MSGWSVEIKNPGSFIIDAHAKFQLRTQATWKESGQVDFIETFIEVEGDVREDTDQLVADGTVDLRNQVAVELTPRDVVIKLDGVTKFEFLKSRSIASPRVEFHQTIDEEGDGDSHWRFGLQIYVKTPPSNSDILEFQTSIKVIKEGKKVVSKIWVATAKGKTLGVALAAVLALKPNDKHLHEEIERQFQQRRATALWVWTTRKKDDVTEIIEDAVEVTSFGPVFFPGKRVGDPAQPPPTAVLHRGRLDAMKIVIRGVVRGQDPKKVKAAIPKQHFAKTFQRERNRAEEVNDLDPRLIDPIKGIHEMRYMEVWISVEKKVPTPNHSNHKPKDPPDCIKAPADGGIAAQTT